MQWLESITHDNGDLLPVYIDSAGVRTTGSLRSGKAGFERRGYQAAVEKQLPLDSMSVADTAEYLEAVGVTKADPSGHRVYALQGQGRRILVPAIVLLWGLIGRLSAVGDRLLEAASLDRVATPIITASGGVEMRFHRKAKLTHDARVPSIQSRFIWLTCFPSARRTWASVYDCAIRGHLGLAPPNAIVDATFAGYRKSDTVYATRMAVRRLVPSERALPFAERYTPSSFVFFEQSATAAKRINDFRASGNAHPRIKTQIDIVKGPAGWKMTDTEWEEVLVELRRAGFSSPKSVKANIDIALEKFGEGKAWSSMGGARRSAETIHQRWARQGKWDLLKGLLSGLRSAPE